jgi:hypothetical protein
MSPPAAHVTAEATSWFDDSLECSRPVWRRLASVAATAGFLGLVVADIAILLRRDGSRAPTQSPGSRASVVLGRALGRRRTG